MKRKYVVILVILLVLIGGGALALRIVVANSEANFERLLASERPTIDLSTIANGVYVGLYSSFPINVEVKVTVKDSRITDIELVKHFNGQGSPAEVIPKEVVEAQSLDIDLVSGATYSSLVILKAIENALAADH